MSDVRSTRLAASGSVVGRRARVRFLHIVCGAGAGSVIIRDGGGSGAILTTIDTPAGATIVVSVDIPGDGLLCDTNAYAELTAVTACTVFYA
jgi:hypothetical protein